MIWLDWLLYAVSIFAGITVLGIIAFAYDEKYLAKKHSMKWWDGE